MKKHNGIKFFYFFIMCTVFTGMIWFSSCIREIPAELPVTPEEGTVYIGLNLSPNLPEPFATGLLGVCFNRTINFASGSANILCKNAGQMPDWKLNSNSDLASLRSDELLLDIQVTGSNYSRQIFSSHADILTDARGICVVPVIAPTDRSSTVSVRLVDVCCSSTSPTKRMEWRSQVNDPFLVLSSNIPVTKQELDAGKKPSTLLTKLVFSDFRTNCR